MLIGEYLFHRLKEHGVRHTFGIPGDFVLPLYQALEGSGVEPVVVTHEPSAGFAADAYARLRGLGAALVTFGAGALNMVNSIAQAYAEKSPVLVISGAPEIRNRNLDALIHHKVRSFESQHAIYREVTIASAVLNDPGTALAEIDRVFEAVLRFKRPGYLEVPRDVTMAPSGSRHRAKPVVPPKDPAALREAMTEVIARIGASRRPVIYAGVEIERFDLREKLIALVEKLNVPIATSVEGKTVFPENHPNFVGIYMGRVGSEFAREYVERSDCLLMLGAFLTDVNTGFFTAKVDRANLISVSSEEMSISYHRYPEVTLPDFLDTLLASRDAKRRTFIRVPPVPVERRGRATRLRTADIVEELNQFVKPGRNIVVSDVGDCLYACIDLRTDHFLAPGYYNSMGFGVPAALAASLAIPERRTVALVGDGGFQMTGMDLATARRCRLNPIVILMNNGGYGTMRAIVGRRSYFDLAPWDYVAIARALGGDGARVETRAAFHKALLGARRSRRFFLIEAVVDPDDISPTWRRIAAGVRNQMHARPGR